MNIQNILLEELYDNKILNKLKEYLFTSYLAGNKSFSIIRFLKKLNIKYPEKWDINCVFGKSFLGKDMSSITSVCNTRKEMDIFIQLCYPNSDYYRSEEELKLSLQHEIVHLIDYIRSVLKNGYAATRNQKKGYWDSDNELSYYADPMEFNQLIHYIKNLSHKIKFSSYKTLLDYLSTDTFASSKMIKDKSFMKRLISRLAREKIDIIKQKKPTKTGRLSTEIDRVVNQKSSSSSSS